MNFRSLENCKGEEGVSRQKRKLELLGRLLLFQCIDFHDTRFQLPLKKVTLSFNFKVFYFC